MTTTEIASVGLYGGPSGPHIEKVKETDQEVYFTIAARASAGEKSFLLVVQGVNSIQEIAFAERGKLRATIVKAKLYSRDDNTWYLLIKVQRSSRLFQVCWNANQRVGKVYDIDQIPD